MDLKKEFEFLTENQKLIIKTGNDLIIRLWDFAKTELNLKIEFDKPRNYIEFSLLDQWIEISIGIPKNGLFTANGELITFVNKEEVKSLTLSFDIKGMIGIRDGHLTLQNFARIYFERLLIKIRDSRIYVGQIVE